MGVGTILAFAPISGGDSSSVNTEIGIASCTGATRYGSAGSLHIRRGGP